MHDNLTNGGNNNLQGDANWLSGHEKDKATSLMQGLRYREVDLMQQVADLLRSSGPKRIGPGGLKVLRRGGVMLLVMLLLLAVAMLVNPTLGLIVLFLTGAQVFATAYAYQVVARETIINLRMSLLGILMSFGLALLAFIGLFF